MNQADALAREVNVLRDRLSRLSEASRRINESLDVDAVLQGVLDSARSLTGASYGVIALFDDAGQVQDFLSSGMTAEEARELWNTPGGMRIFEYLGGVSGPLRLTDLVSHLTSLGFPEFRPPVGPVASFLGTPVLHQRECLGHLFVAEREQGDEFTRDDEETLVMFASQVATVIAYARRYRDEQRAKADLETLVDTSPVGVAVLDARTGAPVSFNRELARITDGLRRPGQSAEELLEVVTIRRANGQEISLQELPLTQVLGAAATMRAEEIVIQAPDGQSVTALVNATPIRAADGAVASVVVTVQDLTPLQDLERLRAEFLAMVSHELRVPLTSVKGSITTLLDPTAALNPTEMRQFHRIIDAQTDRMRELISDLLDVARIETGTLAVAPEATDVTFLVEEARSAFLSGGGANKLQLDLAPDLPWVVADRLRIVQVLNNLLANAARHSQESSAIRLSAVRRNGHVEISVADEGEGVSAERLPHLFRKFPRIDGNDGERDHGGLGLAVCKGIVEAHGGRIWAESEGSGMGARFSFTIPAAEDAGAGAAVGSARSAARSAEPAEEERVRILAVDDDPQALRYIRDALAKAGYAPIVTADPQEALRLMEETQPHLALLDVMLPGTDGVALMQQLLRIGDAPVIFLSAYGQDKTMVRALDMGAVDYVVKPFSPTELAARIRAALRKQAVAEPVTPYVRGDLRIDYTEHRVTLAGHLVPLTAIEYRTLAELAVNAGRVVTYAQLLQRVWGMRSDGDVRPMRTVISRLRSKLGDDADTPAYIFTESRVGYRMV